MAIFVDSYITDHDEPSIYCDADTHLHLKVKIRYSHLYN